MKKKTIGFCLAFLIWMCGSVQADESSAYLKLSLADLIQTAVQNSPQLQAAELSWESAQAQARSAGEAELPRLGLSGNYFYQTYIPQLSLVPNAPAITMGENNNWSAWATLDWNLWDFRSQHNMANSSTALAQSQKALYDATKRQVELAVRLAYFEAQINLEQVRLLGDSLKVAQAQYVDIGHQAQFGTASRMDLLSSHQEVLNYERQFWQSQANLAESLRDLFDLVGENSRADLTAPLDLRMKGFLPEGIPSPTVWLSMDSVESSLGRLQQNASIPPSDTVPQLETYAYLARSSQYAADAIHSQLLPKITLSAQAGYENPIDNFITKTGQQNMVSLSISMPLFDWGEIVNDSSAKQKQAEAYQDNWTQAKDDLWRDWNKAHDALRSLHYQQGINQTAVFETKELARLTYSAYKAGTVRFLEVQTANEEALGAEIQSVSNEVQILMQLSILSSLSGKE